MTQSPPEDPLRLGQKLVAVLEGGRRTSTYKLATILALLDLAVESVPEHPDDAVDVDLDALSERVLAMYWRQIRPIEGVHIRQSSDGRSAILAIVETLRNSVGVREHVGSPAGVEAADPNGYRHVLPWSRVPIDGLANLVLACRRCNGDKSDLLPIPDHHHRAMARGQATLDELASSINWPSQYRRAESAARGIYSTTPAGTPMWCAAKNVRLSSRADFAW